MMRLRERVATFWKKYVVDDYASLFGPEKPTLDDVRQVLEDDPARVREFYELGFISKENAHEYAIRNCRQNNRAASLYLNAGLISVEEAREFLKTGCEL
jgi:hypothetical protein